MKKNREYSALILGGGAAGCSCALWLKQLGHNPLIIEKKPGVGGLQRLNPYPNTWVLGKDYRTGNSFARAMDTQLKAHGVEMILSAEDVRVEHKAGLLQVLSAVKFVATVKAEGKTLEVEAPFLVVATGVSAKKPDFKVTPRVVVGPGPKLSKLPIENKRVAILGGGDNAFENYILLKKKKPKQMQIFARHVRARKQFTEQVPKTAVSVGSYTVDPIVGNVNGEKFDWIVVLYGWEAVNPLQEQFLFAFQNGFIQTDDHRRTSLAGIYAIGEVTQKMHPSVVTAMADGIIAAKDIQERLEA